MRFETEIRAELIILTELEMACTNHWQGEQQQAHASLPAFPIKGE
jgi:hypothetical protein